MEAEDGVAALAFLQQHTIDLIILDYEMPGMNGCEFLEALERTVAQSPPAVLVTGSLRATVWKRAMAAAAKAILSQPYECTTMLSVLEDHLQAGVVEPERVGERGHPFVVQDPVACGGEIVLSFIGPDDATTWGHSLWIVLKTPLHTWLARRFSNLKR